MAPDNHRPVLRRTVRTRPRFLRIATLGSVAGWILSVASLACSVPVFRYGLDRWVADAYRLELPAALLEADPVKADTAGRGAASLNLQFLSPDGITSDGARLLFPKETAVQPEIWRGTLDGATYGALTDSPARRELVRRILDGDSAVWVVVGGSDPERNAAFAKLIEEQNAETERTGTLPERDPDDPGSQLGPGPELKIHFSVLKLSRADAAERFFIAALAGPEGLERIGEDQPFGALVFGRGRVMGSWPAEMLNAERVQQVNQFLLGACTCEAKRLHPGWDLLLRVDWDGELARVSNALKAAGATTQAPPAQLPAAPAPETVVFAPAAPARAPAILDSKPTPRPMLLPITALAGALALFGFLSLRRRHAARN